MMGVSLCFMEDHSVEVLLSIIPIQGVSGSAV